MRILVLSQYFWPETFRINTMVDALEAAGAQVTVLTGQPNYPDGAVLPGYRAASMRRERYGRATEVFRVPIAPRGQASGLRLAINYLSFVASASLFGPWLLRGRQVDVVFVYAPSPITQVAPGMVLKLIKGARLVTWVQDLWPQSLASTGHLTNPALLDATDHAVRWLYRNNDLLLGQSRAFVDAIRPMADGVPVEYFPNPGEADALPAGGPPALKLGAGFNVVFTGNLGTVQALETVVEAATLLRDDDTRFVLVGSGSRASWVADEVARRGLTNVQLAGRFPPETIPGILAKADALLVSLNRNPSLSQTIPAKVQSYLAAGRPILASMDGEGADLVAAAGAGFASTAEDAAGLAANVRRLRALSGEARAQLGRSGRQFYERNFQPSLLATRLLERFVALVAG